MSSPKTPGAVLRKAREDRGLAVKELAAITRISPRLVESLENDRYDDLPAEVFVRGFLRNCARELELDPDHVIALYEGRHPTPAAEPERDDPAPIDEPAADPNLATLFQSSSHSPRMTYVVALLAIILGLGLSILIFGQADTEQLTESDESAPTSWEQAP